MQAEYEAFAKKLQMSTRVKFVGRVEDKELSAYYQRVQVTILPSIDKTEAFGLVLLESMAAGTPIIASNLVGVRSLVKLNKTGWLVKPGSEADLADKIKLALADQSNHQTDCLATASLYDWEKVTDKLETKMRQLCE